MQNESTSSADRRSLIFIAAAALCSAASVAIGLLAPDLSLRWWMFALWFPTVVLAIGHVVFSGSCAGCAASAASPISRHEKLLHRALLLAVCLGYVAFLSSYPFVAIHDEVRDGGLRAQEIANGSFRNIFGRDWSQGLYFATLGSLLYRITGPDVLAYRALGAMFGVLEVWLIYAGFGRVIGARPALIAALIAGTNTCCMTFARTETLISLTPLTITAMLLLSVRFLDARGTQIVVLAAASGMILGLSVGQHASARAPIALLWALLVAVSLMRGRRIRLSSSPVPALAALLLGALIGLGPQLLYLDSDSFMRSGTVTTTLTFVQLAQRYWQSILVLFGAPPGLRLGGGALIPWDVSLLSAAAAVAAVFTRSPLSLISAGLIAALLFTNSAITDLAGQAYRLTGIVPLAAILVADLLRTIRARGYRLVFTALACAIVPMRLLELGDFFWSRRASEGQSVQLLRPAFIAMRHVALRVAADPRWRNGDSLVIYHQSRSGIGTLLSAPHVAEFFSFFLPAQQLVLRPTHSLPDRTLFISPRDGL